MNKAWHVIRHSGRTGYPPRIAFTGTMDRATSFFDRTRAELKQGSVLLMDHAGGVQDYHWARKVKRNGR